MQDLTLRQKHQLSDIIKYFSLPRGVQLLDLHEPQSQELRDWDDYCSDTASGSKRELIGCRIDGKYVELKVTPHSSALLNQSRKRGTRVLVASFSDQDGCFATIQIEQSAESETVVFPEMCVGKIVDLLFDSAQYGSKSRVHSGGDQSKSSKNTGKSRKRMAKLSRSLNRARG